VPNFIKKFKEKLISVWVAELMAFQRSKVLDIDDDTYPIISCYRDFSLERHEAYRHSSELVSKSIQMKLQIFVLGHSYMHYMYPYEHHMVVMKGHVHNHAHLESSMIEGYTTEEVIGCYTDYIKDGKPIGVLVS
jgi:hypothetical protein